MAQPATQNQPAAAAADGETVATINLEPGHRRSRSDPKEANFSSDEEHNSPRGGTTTKTGKRKKKNKKINREHPEFELTYDMMLGIRTTVGKVESKPSRELVLADFNEVTRLRFLSEGTNDTPAHQMRDFKFKDYAPEVFRHIRARFNISPQLYLMCVCGNFQFLEFISNSKSGQFFFYTHDRQFMIKTVSQEECKKLREILPHYYHHIMQHPNTLLTRFYGMHRVKPHKKQEVHFLIFGSVFDKAKYIHTTFDIKGSSQGRKATEKEIKAGNPVFKDNDFLDQHMKIRVGKDKAKLLKSQIEADINFLSRLKIMDYSLLLGIHYLDRPKGSPRNSLIIQTGSKEQSLDQLPRPRVPSVVPEEDEMSRSKAGSVPTVPSEPAPASDANDDADNDTADEMDEKNGAPNVMIDSRVGSTLSAGMPSHERRQSHYGLPKRYDKLSTPQDIAFVAPAFAPVLQVEQKRDEPRKDNAGSLFTRDDGGIRGVDSDGKETNEIYYMGIIDILTTYGVKKRLEHFGKSMKYESLAISAVPPKTYADRFNHFLTAAIE